MLHTILAFFYLRGLSLHVLRRGGFVSLERRFVLCFGFACHSNPVSITTDRRIMDGLADFKQTFRKNALSKGVSTGVGQCLLMRCLFTRCRCMVRLTTTKMPAHSCDADDNHGSGIRWRSGYWGRLSYLNRCIDTQRDTRAERERERERARL